MKRNTAGYGELLRGNRNFRLLWYGQITSLLGDWFNLIASASLISILTGSGVAVGGLFAIRMLAPFLVSPVTGVIADRYDRKRILVITDLARAGTVLLFLLVRTPGQVWLLYALTAVQLGISGLFFPTRISFIPDIVPREGVGTANALSSATWSVMLAVGAALGGLFSGAVGIYPAYILDSATFLVSAAIIALIHFKRSRPDHGSDPGLGHPLREYLDGLRYIAGRAEVLFTVMHKAAISLFLFTPFQVVQVTIAGEVFPIGVGGGISLGLMLCANGIGSGIGPIVARRFTGDRPRALRLMIVPAYLAGALGLAAVAPLLSFWLVLLGAFVRGLGTGTVWVFSTQLLLAETDEGVRGRVFATENALFTLCGSLAAAAVGGGLDSGLGVTGILWIMTAGSLLPATLWAVWLYVRQHRQTGTG